MTTILFYWFISTIMTFGCLHEYENEIPIFKLVVSALCGWFMMPYIIGKTLSEF